MEIYIFYSLIFFLLVLLIGSLWVYKKNVHNNLSLNPVNIDDGDFSQVDCTLNTRICSHDLQCKMMCDSGVHRFRCGLDSGICELETVPNNAECVAEKGFVSALRTTEIDNQWICINTMPHLFTDTGELQKYICGTGSGVGKFDLEDFNVEIEDTDSIISRCSCSDNYVKVVNKARPNIPLCIPEHLIHTLGEFNIVDDHRGT